MATIPKEITNSEDVIDSRDIIARIEYLEDYKDHENDLCELEEDEREELRALRELAEEGSCSPDWEYGETLIRDSYFEEYARELAEDCCELPKERSWPLSYIDWTAAADALKQDYTRLDFDGIEYWIRS